MVTVRAKIHLYANGRDTPFTNGYRPLFDFFKGSLISGQINLINTLSLAPGEEGEAVIRFASAELVGYLGVGQMFAFGEGKSKLGTIVILELISLD